MRQPKHRRIELTVAELNQLMAYVNDRETGHDCGWYYGNKEQFERRHDEIKRKLNEAFINDTF